MSTCECSVCYDKIETARVVLSCNHVYHFYCISKWFCEQEKSSCPMCRKEMEPIDDLPPSEYHEEESEDDDEEYEDEEDELEISRPDLDALLRSLGGTGVTTSMAERLFYEDEPTCLTEVEFNNICMGNGARIISSPEWELLLTKNEMQVTVGESGERIVLSAGALTGQLAVEAEAAVKIQKVWRGTLTRHRLECAAIDALLRSGAGKSTA
jgi:hypothetical protein